MEGNSWALGWWRQQICPVPPTRPLASGQRSSIWRSTYQRVCRRRGAEGTPTGQILATTYFRHGASPTPASHRLSTVTVERPAARLSCWAQQDWSTCVASARQTSAHKCSTAAVPISPCHARSQEVLSRTGAPLCNCSAVAIRFCPEGASFSGLTAMVTVSSPQMCDLVELSMSAVGAAWSVVNMQLAHTGRAQRSYTDAETSKCLPCTAQSSAAHGRNKRSSREASCASRRSERNSRRAGERSGREDTCEMQETWSGTRANDVIHVS